MNEVVQKFKFDESDFERAVENIIAGLDEVQQAALKVAVETKQQMEATQEKQLETYKKVSESQGRVINTMEKNYTKLGNTAEQSAKKQSLAFSKVKSVLGVIGALTGLGTVTAVFRKLGAEVSNFVKEFAKTDEGKKQLEGINLQWAKMKAVASDFLKNALEKIIPILDKVLPVIQKGFQFVTAGIAGAVAGSKAYLDNLIISSKILYNELKIGYNNIKALFGSDDAANKVKELQAENDDLRKGYVDVGKAAKDAYNTQIDNAKKAADGARVVTELTDKQRAAINKLKEEYEKLIESFAKKAEIAQFELIISPVKKLEVVRDKALAELEAEKEEIIKKAKESNQPLPIDLDVQFEVRQKDILKKYRKDISELVGSFIEVNTKIQQDFREGILSDGIQKVFNIPDTVLKDLKSKGIELNQIVSNFLDPKGNQEFEKFFTEAGDKSLSKKIADKVKSLQIAQDQLTKNLDKQDGKKPKSFLGKLLGIDDEGAKEVEKQALKLFGSIQDSILGGISAQITQNDALIQSIQNRINRTEDAINIEQQLQNEGSANNLATKKRELEQLKKEEETALKEKADLQKKYAKQQLISDEIQQASSLATAVAGIFKANSGIPVVGIITAVAAIGSMLALFAKFKAQTKAASSDIRAYKGGSLADDKYKSGWVNRESGRTDRNGGRGHKVEDSKLVLGGKEFVVNEASSAKHAPFLERVNAGKYDGIDLTHAFKQLEEQDRLDVKQGNPPKSQKTIGSLKKYQESTREVVKVYNSEKEFKEIKRLETKLEKVEKERQNGQFVTKAELASIIEKQTKAIRKAIIEEKPEYIPLTKDTKGYLRKTALSTHWMLFEKGLNETKV